MTLKNRFKNVVGDIEEMEKFIEELDSALSQMIGDLEDATTENAVELCKDSSVKLNYFYQQI